MKIYVVYDSPLDGIGDEWTECPTFDKEEAIEQAKRTWNHLTSLEQKKRHVYVGVHRASIQEDDPRTAEQIMSDLIDSDAWPFDHDVIEIK